MRVLGVGLSRTGTTSLARALRMLGYTTLHYDTERLRDVVTGADPTGDVRVYDDVDAVTDLPTAWYYDALLAAYPGLKCVLTVRDEAKWWRSVEAHFNRVTPVATREDDPFRWDLRTLVYGSADAREASYRERFREHNARVLARVPADRLLVLDITAGDGWETLCPFLGVPVPDGAFPRDNKGAGHARRMDAVGAIEAVVERGASFVLVSDGWFGVDGVPGRVAIPFLERNGHYIGKAANDAAAIAEVVRQREAGARYLVFLWTTFWWLEHYRGLREYLEGTFRCVARNDRVVAFSLA